MRMKSIGAMALALLLFAPSAGRANTAFAYQGRLMLASGETLTSYSYSIRFSIYDQATGGTALWTCTRDVRLSEHGQFSVDLSDPTNSSDALGALFAANVDKTLYIGLAVLKVGNAVLNDAEIAPRQKIMTVPKASWAANCKAAKGNLSVAGASGANTANITQALSAGSISTPGEFKCGTLAVGGLTAPNITVKGAVEGKGVIPVGGIVIWSGYVDNMPSGWALCNGSDGTPDLRARFVVGAGGSGYNLGSKAGEAAHKLTAEEMPKHRHSYSFTGADLALVWASGNSLYCQHNQYSNNKNSPWTDYAGGDQPHENRPPYYALCYIMRVR